MNPLHAAKHIVRVVRKGKDGVCHAVSKGGKEIKHHGSRAISWGLGLGRGKRVPAPGDGEAEYSGDPTSQIQVRC